MAQVFKRIEKNIFQRGPYSYQVKLKVGKSWISETFDTLREAQDFRDSKRIAKNHDADYRRIVGSRRAKRKQDRETLAEMFTRYEAQVSARKRHPQAELYRIGVIKRAKIGSLPFQAVAGDDLEAFLASLECAESTKLRYVAVISHLYSVARTVWKRPVQNPIHDIVKPIDAPHRNRRVNDEEWRQLLIALDSPVRRNRLLNVAARLAYLMPVREDELLTLRRRNVNLENSTITVQGIYSKAGETRTVPLYPEAIELLRTHMQTQTGERLFPMTQSALVQSWRRVVARARRDYEAACAAKGVAPESDFLVDLRFHDLRHECISQLYENTELRDREIMVIAGHKSLTTTGRYTHLRVSRLVPSLARAAAVASRGSTMNSTTPADVPRRICRMKESGVLSKRSRSRAHDAGRAGD